MTRKEERAKKTKIKKLVKSMLKQSQESAISRIDALLKSGGLDIENYDMNVDEYVLPKNIVQALLSVESDEWSLNGTRYEKQSKKNVKNIKSFCVAPF